MTHQEVIDLTDQFLAYNLDSMYETSATTAQGVNAVSWALRTMAKREKLFDPSTVVNLVSGQSSHELRSLASDGLMTLKLRSVTVNRVPITDASRDGYGIWSYVELERAHPQWRTASSRTPTWAVHVCTKLLHAASANSARS
jgi:hypothetical protein